MWFEYLKTMERNGAPPMLDVTGRALSSMQWRQATSVQVRFRGHKGDQAQQGSSVIRVRDVSHGPHSQIGAGGGAVALLVELMSCHMALPGNTPLCSFHREGGAGTAVLGYRRALKAFRQMVELVEDNPKNFGLHSLRIGGATAMAAGGEIPDRIVQREGRWKRGSGTMRKYTRNNSEDASAVSNKLTKGGRI